MRPIDEKIISMKLDNRDFANKAAETTGIIGTLTRTLNMIPGVNLGKTTKDLQGIHSQANKTTLDRLLQSVQSVSGRFTTMGIIGVTALQNITNKAVDAGLQLTKSLTTDQITAGFNEYELKIGSIRTILANTQWNNTSLDEVKGSLEELNTYADQTVYNFAQMTQNIGRFTAAGVKLDDATIAIKGLSNLAATSGADVNQLNTAMYQMSQAMASGKLNLMDWNSLVNAGMGGKMTQDALLATARGMGKVVDTSDGFRNSIQKGWLTSEVLLETLKKFGDDPAMIEAATKVRTLTQFIDTLKESIGSGWAMTFEHIFGDFEEATDLWSGIAEDVTGWIGKTSDARNKFFEESAKLGAMDNIFQGVRNGIKPIIQLYEAMREGISRVFPPVTVAQFVKITQTFKTFTAGLALSASETTRFTTIFQGVAAAFSTIIEIGKRVGQMLMSLVPEGTGGALMNLLERLAQMSISFNQSVKDGNGLTDAIDGLGRGIKSVIGFVSDASGHIIALGVALKDRLGKALKFVVDLLKPIGAYLKDAFGGVGMEDVLGAGTLAGGFVIFKKFGDMLGDITGIFGEAKSGISDLFGGLTDALSSFTQQVKYNNLLKIAVALGILAVSLKLLEGMETEDIVTGLAALGGALGVMLGAMAVIEKYNITGGIKASLVLIALASAVTIMASALKKLSGMSFDEIIRGLTGLVGVTGALVLAVIALSAFGGKIKVSSLQLIALATAILILSQAVENLSAIDTPGLWKAIAGLGVIFAELALFMKIVDGSKMSITSAIAIVAITGAIHIMVAAIKTIADIDTPNLVKGLATIALILAEIVVFSKLASGPTLILAGTGLLAIAAALTLLMVPIKLLSSMTWEELVKGIGGMTVAIVALAGAAALMSGGILAGAGIIAMATGLTLLMIPIKVFSAMSWQAMVKGFGGLALAMGLLAGASLLLSPAILPMLGFSAAVAAMGLAMLAAGAGVGLFATGLVTLATLTATSIASIIAALGLLIKGLGDLIIYVVDFVVKLGIALLDGIDKLVPKLVKVVVNLIIVIMAAIAGKLPEFLRLGAEIIIALIDGIASFLPQLIDSALNLIVSFVEGVTDGLSTHGPRIINAFMKLLGEVVLLVIQTGMELINAILGWIPGVQKATGAVTQSAEEYIDEHFGMLEVGAKKGEEFATGIASAESVVRKSSGKLSETGMASLESFKTRDIGVKFGTDFASGITSKQPDVAKAAFNLGNVASFNMENSLQVKSPSRVTTKIGEHTGTGLANGIESTKPKVKKAAKSVADVVKEEFEKSKDWISERKYYNELSLNEELEAWKKIQVKYKAGTEQRKEADREVYRVKQELLKAEEEAIKKQFDSSKSWIDDRKYYNEISLKEELAAWERMQKRYKEGTDMRKQADREVYRLKNELIKAEEDAVKKQLENSKSFIDDRKYYNEMSLTQELEAWERVQARYKKGTDERKQADREVYRLKNELNSKLVQLNDDYMSKIQEANRNMVDEEFRINEEYSSKISDLKTRSAEDELKLNEDYTSKIQALNTKSADEELKLKESYASKIESINTKSLDDELKLREDYLASVEKINDQLIKEEQRLTDEYDKALSDRTKALVGFAGLFDEVPKKNDLTGQQLADNLKGQVDAFYDWSNDIASLAERGIDEGLLSELRDMGPKAAGEIAALNSLTDDQLTEYALLWQTKNELARRQAVSEMETLRLDTYSEIEKLKSETANQLESLNVEWLTKTDELRKQTTAQVEALNNELRIKREELISQTAIQLAALNAEWFTKTEELRTQTERQLSDFNREWGDKITQLRAQTAAQLDLYKNEWVSKIQELSKGTKEEFVELTTDMKTVGSDIVKGMMTGMKSMEGSLLAQAKAMADAVANAMKTTLKIKSPSRITEALGEFTGEGLVVGMGNRIKDISNKAKQLASTANNSIARLLEGFDLPEEDNEIHIKAVVDWDGFNPNDLSAKALRIMPDTSFTTSGASSVTRAKRQNDNNVRSNDTSGSNVEHKSVVVNQNLSFSSRTLSPSEVARKNLQASRQLATQWGV